MFALGICVCKLFLLFWVSFQRLEDGKVKQNWLLLPIGESNLQLFALVSLWISSKVCGDFFYPFFFGSWGSYATAFLCSKFINLQIHDSPPLSVKSLKYLGDKFVMEQHYTMGDFLEAVRSFF